MQQYMIDALKKSENYEKFAYKDSEGILTIGYGTNIEDGLEEFEAEALLVAYIKYLERELPTKVSGWEFLNSARRDVLVSMAYNLGIPRFLKFERMLGAIAIQNYKAAAIEILDSLAAKQTGKTRYASYANIMRGYNVA